MRLGVIGLGRMGANMCRRLMRAGHECVVYDASSTAVQTAVAHGAIGSSSLQDGATLRFERPQAVRPQVAFRMRHEFGGASPLPEPEGAA